MHKKRESTPFLPNGGRKDLLLGNSTFSFLFVHLWWAREEGSPEIFFERKRGLLGLLQGSCPTHQPSGFAQP